MISIPMISLVAVVILCIFQLGAAAPDMEKYYKRTGAKYLRQKAEESGVISLESGMLVEILKESSKSDAKSPTAGGSTLYTIDQIFAY